MDLNLQFWKREGKTFPQRFRHWLDILDPLLLFKSKEEIETSRMLLQTSGPDITESLQNKKIKAAWTLNLASVHPGTGEMIPAAFRPPAFLPFTVPLVIGTLLPYRGAKQTFFLQSLFHTYTSAFSLAHGNVTPEQKEFPQKQMLLGIGAVLYSASIVAFPQYIMARYQQSPPMQTFVKKVLPGPLAALLCALNVLIIREGEIESGIEIMDSNGYIVGVSQKAGEKAVTETALSRVMIFGTALLIPDTVLHYLKRTNILARIPFLWGPLRSILIISGLGVMIPVSFSWMPQLGMIQRSLIEPHIISSTEETEFFYNRGL